MNFISKTIQCLFTPLLALLLCAFVTDSAVCAVPNRPLKAGASKQESAPLTSPLAVAAIRLKQLGQGVKEPKARLLINDVVNQAGQIDKAGAEVASQMVQEALDPVEKVLGYINTKASKSEDCSVCSELSEIDSEIAHCCKEIKELLGKILFVIEAAPPCGEVFTISKSMIPHTIRHPGKYCVIDELTYDGIGAAITVAASNVTLNFHDHNLTLTGGGTGVLVQNVREFVLENDLIQAVPPSTAGTSFAVHLTGVHKAALRNIYTLGTNVGVQIDTASKSVSIENTFLQHHALQGVAIDASEDIYIDTCTFDGADQVLDQIGLLVLDVSKNVSVTNSTFTGWDAALYAVDSTGILVDNCMVVGSSDATYYALVQLGDDSGPANDVILRNSTFKYSGSVTGADGLLLYNGEGLVLENIIVDTSTSFGAGYDPAAIHIGCGNDEGNEACNPPVYYNNVLAEGCIVTGKNATGLLVDAGNTITFANSQFTNARVFGVFLEVNASSCTITNSTISNNTTGVYMGADNGLGEFVGVCAENNAIVRNVLSGNQYGIVIEQCSVANPNLVTDNRVFDSTCGGIINCGTFNGTVYGNDAQIWFNTAVGLTGVALCPHLPVVDCVGVAQAQAPGASKIVGSDICGTTGGVGGYCPFY